MTPLEREQWEHFHQIIFRATHEVSNERYLHFTSLADALCDRQERPMSDPVVDPALYRRSTASSFSTPSPEGDIDENGLSKEQRADYMVLAFMSLQYLYDHHYENALKSIDLLFSTYPQSQNVAMHYANRATALMGLNRYQEGLKDIERSLEMDAHPTGYQVRIKLWKKLGELSAAEADATTVLREFHPTISAYLQRIDIRLLRGNLAGAEDDLKAAANIDDDPERKKVVASLRASLAERYPEFGAYLGMDGRKETLDVQVSEVSEFVANEALGR